VTWPGPRGTPDWLSVDDARARVLALVAPLPTQDVDLAGALNRALAEPIDAPATLPPWDNSAMDGYAVRGADVAGASAGAPVELAVVGEARAGARWEGAIEAGEAVRIMTGGPIPDGADSVVRVEDTDREARTGRVQIRSDRDRGRNLRPGGQDMRAGDRLLEAGQLLSPGALALAAAAGRATVSVHRRPRLGILTSGDELRGPEAFDDVRAGRGIPDSNGPMLMAAAAELGVEAVVLGPVRDRAEEVRARLEGARAADLDLLVTVGGASMGGTDLFRDVLTDLGAALDFWRVRMRPGSPFSAALLPRPGTAPLPILGLPGNPASAFVTFCLFVRPALLTLAGHRRVDLPVVTARAGARLTGGAELTHFVRVRLDQHASELVATPTGPQGSGLVSGLAGADGLAIVPRGTEEIAAGSSASVMLLRLPLSAPS
jgi:molybdopterin molybdotransferase